MDIILLVISVDCFRQLNIYIKGLKMVTIYNKDSVMFGMFGYAAYTNGCYAMTCDNDASLQAFIKSMSRLHEIVYTGKTVINNQVQ